MARMKRLASKAQFDKLNIYLGNHGSNAQIICDSVRARRATFSTKKMTRIICAVHGRRVQPTNQTQYAVEFDAVKLSTGAIFPPIINQMFISTPNNGRASSQRSPYNVGITPKDYTALYNYISSSLFRQDLIDLRSYGTANQLSFVNLNLSNGSSPPIILRLDESLASKTTLPKEWRHQDTVTYALSSNEVSLFTDSSDKSEWAKRIITPAEVANCEAEGYVIQTLIIDHSFGEDTPYSKLTMVSQSDSGEYGTPNESSALVAPMFIYSPTSTLTEPGADSSLFAGRVALEFEFQGELQELSSRGINTLFNQALKDAERTSRETKVLGRTSSPRVDVPSYEVPGEGFLQYSNTPPESDAYAAERNPGDGNTNNNKFKQTNSNSNQGMSGNDQQQRSSTSSGLHTKYGSGRGGRGKPRDTRTNALTYYEISLVRNLLSTLSRNKW